MHYMQNPIDEDDVKILGRIGEGAYGDVFKVLLKSDPNVEYALKIIDKRKLSLMELDAIHNELAVHRMISHNNVVK